MTDSVAITHSDFLLMKLGTMEVTALGGKVLISSDHKFKISGLEINSGSGKSVFILETSTTCSVRIENTKVFALAHLEPQQVFFIDEEPYAILKSGVPFVNSHTPKILETPLDENLLKKDQADFPKKKLSRIFQLITVFQVLLLVLINNVSLTELSAAKEEIAFQPKPQNLSQNQRKIMLQDLENRLAPAEIEIVEKKEPVVEIRKKSVGPKQYSLSVQNRELLESYLLEGRFDAESSREKIRSLASSQKDKNESEAILAWLHKI